MRWIKEKALLLLWCCLVQYAAAGINRATMEMDSLKNDCLADLRRLMAEQQEWVKVHAAEYLLWSGYPEGVKKAFLREETKYGNKPAYRIGIWRVLAQVANLEKMDTLYGKKVLAAFEDEKGSDRIHAAETLAKLHLSPLLANKSLVQRTLSSERESLVYYTRWSLAYTNDDSLKTIQRFFLKQLIDYKMESIGEGSAQLIAYIVGRLAVSTIADWDVLVATAWREPDSSKIKPYMLQAACLAAPRHLDKTRIKPIKDQLIALAMRDRQSYMPVLLLALAACGDEHDLNLLQEVYEMFKDKGSAAYLADNHAVAAYALLRVIQRIEN